MAEQELEVSERAEASADAGGGSLLAAVGSMVAAVFTGVAVATSMVWNAITDDGVLAAAGRQGIDELGKALEPFPNSIHSDEIGTVFSPTQGEIASSRGEDHSHGFGHSTGYSSYSRPAGPPETWPSEIAKGNHTYDPGQDLGHDQDQGYSL